MIVGFINGVGLIIIFSQLGSLLGLELKQADFFPRLVEFFSNLHKANGLTFGIGMICLASLLFSQRFFPKAPEPVFMVVLVTMVVAFFGLESMGIKEIGQVPPGLPKLALPHLSFADAVMVLPTSMGVAFISYADIMAEFSSSPVPLLVRAGCPGLLLEREDHRYYQQRDQHAQDNKRQADLEKIIEAVTARPQN